MRLTRLLPLAVLLLAAHAEAQPFPREDVPPELKPWIPWVLDGEAAYGCARVADQPVCLWPGRLRLALSPTGGSFSLDLQADRATDVPLPGDEKRWPAEVQVDGRPAAVLETDDGPQVRVTAGAHHLSGSFGWRELPDALPVPAAIGMVDLTIAGRAVPLARRDQEGLLWLREGEAAGVASGEALRVQVFRKIEDGVPLFVETRLALEVSGKAREVELAGALLPDSVPVAVSGDLPARLDRDLRLRVQVRPGRFTVAVRGRLDGDVRELRPPAGGPEPREVWVFAGNDALRQVEVSGASAIDPSRTDLPQEWRALPAYLVEAQGGLKLTESRRGQPEPPPDALQLSRELWLDLDGRGLTVRDTLSGALRRASRLELLAPGELGRVAVGGQDQLITADPESRRAGVELRSASLALVAESRLPREGGLPAVGWSADVEQLGARLHLPPGWMLFAATGVDAASDAWTGRWTLLGFFFVLLIGYAVAQLHGWRAGLLALAAMVLSYGEREAPFLLWLSLVGAIALRRVTLPTWPRRLVTLWWLLSAGLLGLALFFFFAGQLRGALHPYAGTGVAGASGEEGYARSVTSELDLAAPMPAAPPAALEAPAQVAGNLRQERKADDEKRDTSKFNEYLVQEPHAVLQTGPGVPAWSWRAHELRWSGPVTSDHQMRLWLLSPRLNLLLTLVRLALLGGLLALLLGWRFRRPPAPVVPMEPAAALLLLTLAAPLAARADEPPSPAPERLAELKEKLTRAEPCQPRCLSTARLSVSASADRLSLTAEVHAAAAAAWPVPGPSTSWVPSEVRVDGAPSAALARLEDGFLHLRLSPGVHRVELVGPLPAQDTLTLQLPSLPHRASVEAPAWQVAGVREDGPPDESIQLTRRLATPASGGGSEVAYAPWLEVTRTLEIGVSWRVHTAVRRVSPPGAPVSVRVPLLPGESITSGEVEATAGEASVTLAGDETETRWTSTLEPRPELRLEAPQGRTWSEVWRVQCGLVWQCAPEGIPPVSRQQGEAFLPEYRPWPGEVVTVHFRHPQGVAGQTVTIDEVLLEETPGIRLSKSVLTLRTRSSREEALTLALPAEAEVQELLVAGQPRPARPESGKLRFTVPAGSQQVRLTWHQSQPMGVVHHTPALTLPRPAVNLHLVLALPEDRWLMATRGPDWGPSVLFWAYLVVVLLAAWALARVPGSPLGTLSWTLLALGITQIPVPAALVIVGWLFALSWRARRPPQRPWLFDLVQLVLVPWALAALLCLYSAVERGLRLRPDMDVSGGGSTAETLRWYADRVPEAIPVATVYSLPVWAYRVAMLAWAAWLTLSLIRGASAAWRAFNEGGLWRPLRRPRVPPPAAPTAEEQIPPGTA